MNCTCGAVTVFNSFIKKARTSQNLVLAFLFSLKLLGELIQGGAPFCQASVFFGLVEIVSIEKFGKGYAGALAKALHSNDLGAFCSALKNIVNRRGRHPAAQGDIAYVAVTLDANFLYPFDNSVIQFHSNPTYNFVEFHNYYRLI